MFAAFFVTAPDGGTATTGDFWVTIAMIVGTLVAREVVAWLSSRYKVAPVAPKVPDVDVPVPQPQPVGPAPVSPADTEGGLTVGMIIMLLKLIPDILTILQKLWGGRQLSVEEEAKVAEAEGLSGLNLRKRRRLLS